ncbi:hypothetical protein SAMN05216312_102463 [Cohnella sp. OV330]|nr:hypothetical protein SAMN05216312_102463 [Cohnella sp. OV330]
MPAEPPPMMATSAGLADSRPNLGPSDFSWTYHYYKSGARANRPLPQAGRTQDKARQNRVNLWRSPNDFVTMNLEIEG